MSEEEKERIRGIIRQMFGVYADKAILIAECESGYDVNAINFNDAKKTGYNSWGLFMHNEPQFVGWNDPVVSTAKAWDKFTRRGWGSWYNCSKKFGLI